MRDATLTRARHKELERRIAELSQGPASENAFSRGEVFLMVALFLVAPLLAVWSFR